MILCPVSITYTPEGGAAIVLCAAGGWLMEPPQIDAAQDIASAAGILHPKAWFRPLGGARVDIRLLTYQPQAGNAAAQTAFLAAGTGLLGTQGVLEFSGDGDTASYPAAVTSVRPDLPAWPEAALVRDIRFRASLPTLS